MLRELVRATQSRRAPYTPTEVVELKERAKMNELDRQIESLESQLKRACEQRLRIGRRTAPIRSGETPASDGAAPKDSAHVVFALKHCIADERLVDTLLVFFEGSGDVRIHADQRTNSLIVLADQNRMAQFRKLVALLDMPDDENNAGAQRGSKFAGEQAGQEWNGNGLQMKFAWCRPGFVTMEQVELIVERRHPSEVRPAEGEFVVSFPGAPEGAARENTTEVKAFISRGYWLGKYEATQGEWKQVMESEPWKGQGKVQAGDSFPATCVTWDEAMAFCQKLTQQERAAGRLPPDWEYTLPTEAQWERGCRAGSTTAYCFGDDPAEFGDFAWFIGNAFQIGESYAHRVGEKRPNQWGLHDMHGNVWEWCRDWYSPKLPGGRDPEVSQGRGSRVYRGGGWGNQPIHSSSAYRYFRLPSDQDDGVGFRVAVTAAAPEAE